MRTSSNGVNLIKRFEGLELEAYQDIAGIWTIGYGHTGQDVEPGMKISEKDAEEMLKRDLKPREDAVSKLTNVSLNQNEFDALVSFIYNVGIEAYRGSTARRRLNKGDRPGAADALTWWNKATVNGILREVTGLTRRRAAERALFLEPVNPPIVRDEKQVSENSRLTPVEDAPRRPNLAESRTMQGATVAGGAGVAATTMGRNSANELDNVETEIERGGSGDAGNRIDDAGDSPAPADTEQTPAETPDEQASQDEGSQDSGAQDGASHDGAQTDQSAEAAGDDEGTSETGDAGAGGDEETTASDDDNADGVNVRSGVGETFGSTEEDGHAPAKHVQHAADAQVQFALLILVVLAVLYIIFARLDDWWRFRR